MRMCVLILFLLLALPTLATAGFQGTQSSSQGGFQGPSATANVTSVAQAKSAADDTPVVLTGHIVRREAGDHEHYLFRDHSGEIVVDIDDTYFLGRTVTPQTKIRIYGEVDREAFAPTKIDVKQLDILQ